MQVPVCTGVPWGRTRAAAVRLSRSAPLLAALLLAVTAPGCRGPAPRVLPPAYEMPYGTSPFAPAEPRIRGAALLDPDALAGSARCGACHPQIYQQWQDSLHRAAATDPFFRFAADRTAEDYGIASTRLCEGCHDPGRLLSGGVDRGATAPREASRREGVSCLSCHLVASTHACLDTGVVANASYEVVPLPDGLLYPDPGDAVDLRHHGAALRRPFLSDNAFCDACHRFFVPAEWNGWPPGRLRLQSQEALGTPYGDPSHPEYQSCVDCHMPLMAGSDPAAKDGRIHDHRSLGSNLLVPSLEGNRLQADATLAFRRAGAVTLEPGVLERGPDGALWLPVTLRNLRNGHDFPTGATDVSEAWLELELRGPGGEVAWRSPGLDARRFLSEEAPGLNSVVVLPGGDLDYLHDLASQVALREHPRIRPRDSRELRIPVRVPAGVTPPLEARVVLRARHGNERWNTWTFNFQDVEVPVADLAEATRTLVEVPPALPPAPATGAAPPPAAGDLPAPPPGMVRVPAGEYPVGADPRLDPDAEPEESPPHRVRLAAFFLDRQPVTQGQWADAVRRGVVPAPRPRHDAPLAGHAWVDGRPPAGLADHPVVLVTFQEAEAYCAARGARLPTEAEWEAAARGTDGRRYAWGDTFDPARCNTVESGRGTTVPAGSQPANASPFGARDMGCNVVEWVSDVFQAYPRVRHGDNRDDWIEYFPGFLRSQRGASYDQSRRRSRASQRGFDGDEVRQLIGVRCAKDAGESP